MECAVDRGAKKEARATGPRTYNSPYLSVVSIEIV